MRRGKWLLAAALGLILTGPAWSQRTVTFNGADPLKLAFQPIDTSQSVVPIARPQTLQTAKFSLKDILPKVGLPGAKTTRGQSNFPDQSGMPGPGYLSSFGFQRPAPIKP